MKKPLIITVSIVIILLFLSFWVIPYFTRPVGVPLDFYELSENIEESQMDIYYMGDHIPLNERVSYTGINTAFDVPIYNSRPYKVVIIDYNDSTILSEEEITRIKRLYLEECYYIFLINHTGDFNDLISNNDSGTDLIILDFITCDGDNYSSNGIDFPANIDEQTKQYILTDQLEKKIE